MLDYGNIKGQLPDSVFDSIENCVLKYKINTKLRLAHFLAQCKHESVDFTRTEENLNYSADGLLQAFRKYFTEELASEYAHNKVGIASIVYADRMGNGNVSTQDGWTYRGRGYIQLTGRDNYKAFDAVCSDDIVANPNLVATKYPMESAAWFWSVNKINNLADINDIDRITKKINGGLNGLDKREVYFDRYMELIKGE